MKVKKEYGVLVAIIVALVLYLVFRDRERAHYRLPELPRVTGTEISKIEISKAEGSIRLIKRDNRWYIDPRGFPADTREVREMLATIENLTLTALVSESKNYSRYDLNTEKKINVKAWAENKLRRELEVGKGAPSFRHTFVKLAGDDRVYHARGNFRGKFGQTVEDLWDRTVLSFERTEIEGIHITKGQQSIHLSRTGIPVEIGTGQKPDAGKKSPPEPKMLWQSADGKEGDQSAINRLLATLSNLRCQKYVEDRKKEDLKDPIYSVTLSGADEYTLSIFAKTDEEAKSYPALSSQSDFPFLLSEGQAKGIMKNPAEMVERPPKS
jgi:hypothetical protein